MHTRTRHIALAAIVSASLFGAWIYFGPHLTLHAMVSAARARDAAALNRHVNYPAIRANLKTNFTEKLSAGSVGTSDDHPLASLGPELMSALVNPIVDYLVTPENIALMLQGDVPRTSGGSGKPASFPRTETEAVMSYEGVNRFVVKVRTKGADEPAVGFVFTRAGIFSWQLSAVELPL